MKIVIYNDELRSEMQMYLALSHKYDVEIAQNVEDLMNLLAEHAADLTFLDLDIDEDNPTEKSAFELAEQIMIKFPKIKVVGICDDDDSHLKAIAAHQGIPEVITRPIKNRELLKVVEKSRK
jgi:DNA-binding NtrC family response regulator